MTWTLGVYSLPTNSVFASLILVYGCAPAPAPGPCLRWVNPGQTYEATLGKLDPFPDAKGPVAPRSCGTGFDLSEGDMISFRTQAPESPSPSCDMIAASVSNSIRTVALGEAANIAGGVFNPNVEADFPHATIGQACRGNYEVGLNETDSVLRAYRSLHVDTVDECVAEGVNVDKDNPSCWDSWRVVVTGSKGTVVATSVD